MPAYFLPTPKLYQSIKALPWVRPVYDFGPNIVIDKALSDLADLTMDWEKMKRELQPIPLGATVLIDFEPGDNNKWAAWDFKTREIRQEVVDTFATMLDVAKTARPDCRFMFFSCPPLWPNIVKSMETNQLEALLAQKLITAFAPIVNQTCAISPGFYRPAGESIGSYIDYVQTYMTLIKRSYPTMPIIPTISPCLDCGLNLMPANEFAAILHAMDVENVIVWATDKENFPQGIKTTDDWMVALQSWEIGNAIHAKNSIAKATAESIAYRRSLAMTI